jgi:hypothetical protein
VRFAVAEHLKGKPATILELLTALPEEDLHQMRAENNRALELARAELARLRVEEQQLKEAFALREAQSQEDKL